MGHRGALNPASYSYLLSRQKMPNHNKRGKSDISLNLLVITYLRVALLR
jgi:hypothetical protein